MTKYETFLLWSFFYSQVSGLRRLSKMEIFKSFWAILSTKINEYQQKAYHMKALVKRSNFCYCTKEVWACFKFSLIFKIKKFCKIPRFWYFLFFIINIEAETYHIALISLVVIVQWLFNAYISRVCYDFVFHRLQCMK